MMIDTRKSVKSGPGMLVRGLTAEINPKVLKSMFIQTKISNISIVL